MAHVRYQVDGIHPNGWAHAWFPMPPLSPAGFSSIRRFIHGFMGTERVPSPRPAGSHTLSDSRNWCTWSDPRVAPPWFAPQVWWHDINELPVGPTASGMGIRYLRTRHAVLVPPVTPIGTLGPLGPSKVAMGGRKIGGRRSMHWPRAVVRWPNLSGEYES